MGIKPCEDLAQIGLGHGGATCGGDFPALPEVEEDAGAEAGGVVRIVCDDGSQLVAADGGNHGFGAGPVTGDFTIIDDLIVVT
jgi:hypothetical protein